MTILKNKKINLIKEKGKLVIMQPSLQFFGIVKKNSAKERHDCHSKNYLQCTRDVKRDNIIVSQKILTKTVDTKQTVWKHRLNFILIAHSPTNLI